MADFTSTRRSASESVLSPLGGAQSGAPSGSPWPTGAYSYSANFASPALSDLLSTTRTTNKSPALGATGPQASGTGLYTDPSAEPAERDLLTRMRARSGLIAIGTSYQPTGGYYSTSSATPLEHDAPSVQEKLSPLPAITGGSVLYRLRARDSSGPLNDPTRFVYWTSAILSLVSYTGPLPFGGPLVELTIMDSFSSN